MMRNSGKKQQLNEKLFQFSFDAKKYVNGNIFWCPSCCLYGLFECKIQDSILQKHCIFMIKIESNFEQNDKRAMVTW